MSLMSLMSLLSLLSLRRLSRFPGPVPLLEQTRQSNGVAFPVSPAGGAGPGSRDSLLSSVVVGGGMSEDSFVSLRQDVGFARVAAGPGFTGIHWRIAEQAAQAPEAPALVCGERCLSYSDLEVRTAALSRRLRALGVGPHTV